MDWLFEVADEIRKSGSYSIQKVEPVEPEIVAPKKTGYFSRATVKAIESIIGKASKCKEKEDFEAVIALERVFHEAHRYSVLQSAGWKIKQNFRLDRTYIPKWSTAYERTGSEYEEHYVEFYEWEKPDLLSTYDDGFNPF